MSNHVMFTSPKQGQRLKALEEELRFRGRVLQEAKAQYEKAKQATAAAVDEIGAPADGRAVVFEYEPREGLVPGVYFETFELKWDPQRKFFLPRTREEGLAWVKEMAGKGAKIDVPPDDQPSG